MQRSYLYVPGDRPDRLVGALDRGADAVIADLEDGVAPPAKDAARAAVAEFLGLPRHPDAPEILVRVNPGPRLADDVTAAVTAGGRSIYLPKADVTSLAGLDALLSGVEARAGVASGAVAVVALIESATGLQEVAEVARHPRVRNLALGEADLTADLGIHADPDSQHALWPLRMQLVVASAAAGINPPTGPVHTDLADPDGLRRSSVALARAGFGARAGIHPSQVPVINEAFSPTEHEIAAAARTVELYEASVARGDGVVVDDAGRMLDEAVIRSARRVLQRGGAG